MTASEASPNVISISPVFVWSAPFKVYTRALITNKNHATGFEEMQCIADSLCVQWRDMVKAFWRCEGHVTILDGVTVLKFVAPNGDVCFLY